MSDMVSAKDRGVLQGYNSLVFALGIAVGAPLGGVLADTLGWRWAFALQVRLTGSCRRNSAYAPTGPPSCDRHHRRLLPPSNPLLRHEQVIA